MRVGLPRFGFRLAAVHDRVRFACALQGTTGEVYNIGSQRERTVVEVAADICRLFGLDPERQVCVMICVQD